MNSSVFTPDVAPARLDADVVARFVTPAQVEADWIARINAVRADDLPAFRALIPLVATTDNVEVVRRLHARLAALALAAAGGGAMDLRYVNELRDAVAAYPALMARAAGVFN